MAIGLAQVDADRGRIYFCPGGNEVSKAVRTRIIISLRINSGTKALAYWKQNSG